MNRCPDCGYKGELKARDATHHLDGVAFVGVKEYLCPSCEAVHVGFSRMEILYRNIARELADLKRRLKPEEVRWLRKYLGYSGSDFAEYLGVTRETVSRWENGHVEVPLATERLLRMMAKAGPHIDEYGTPAKFAEDDGASITLRRNSTGDWVRA